MKQNVLSNLAHLSLEEIAQLAAQEKLPPVSQWQPERDMDSHMRIDKNGQWYHHDEPIKRESLARLFSTILRREDDGRYALVTPFERQFITVDDMPFLAVEMKSEGKGEQRTIAIRLNNGRLVIVDASAPILIDENAQHPAPFVTLQNGLCARFSRALSYEIFTLALEESATYHFPAIGVYSHGHFCKLASK